MWVKMLCLLGTTFARGSKGNSWEELEASRCSGTLSSNNQCLNSCSQSGTPCNSPLRNSSSSFLFVISISVDSCHEFPPANESSLAFSLLLVAGISVSVTVSCDGDVGEVDVVEQLVDKPGTANGTWFDVSQWIFLPFLMRCGFWPLVQWELYANYSQSFPYERTAGVFSRSITVTPIHGRIPLPLLLLALRRWLSLPSSEFSISSRSPIRLCEGLSCWPCACLLRNLPRTLFLRGLMWMRPAWSTPQKVNRMWLCLPFWA